ncbi:conserved Plasmodium protein, unknown function [Plasmodium berghei ANKA]|uniref:Uncharacterized protein n=1 Tax=Plasmodium berghei (strain Anka) TaxID=5823 RepID=A0A509AL15_PLABA|nr:conserved Plasmodium protein, unknown function [Plasmodium berghei ANKA]VUC55482.1 conserved Plasmodium protein, unknown function [Plasmodium berghei ANKA]|eukprot:XP_034421295.1 conserved Plasmodium protein, unknown function [Plasmodium berghei ANKA]
MKVTFSLFFILVIATKLNSKYNVYCSKDYINESNEVKHSPYIFDLSSYDLDRQNNFLINLKHDEPKQNLRKKRNENSLEYSEENNYNTDEYMTPNYPNDVISPEQSEYETPSPNYPRQYPPDYETYDTSNINENESSYHKKLESEAFETPELPYPNNVKTKKNYDNSGVESNNEDTTEVNYNTEQIGMNGIYDNNEPNGIYENNEPNDFDKNKEANGIYENKEANGIYDNNEPNGIYENNEPNDFDKNKEANGIYENKEANGIYDNNEPNGIYENNEPNDFDKNKEANGIYENNEPNGIYENNEPNGIYENNEPNDFDKNKEANGIYENNEPNGIYENNEPNGIYENNEPNGIYENNEPNDFDKNKEANGIYENNEPNGIYENNEPNGIYENNEPNDFDKNKEANGIYENNEPNDFDKNKEANGIYENNEPNDFDKNKEVNKPIHKNVDMHNIFMKGIDLCNDIFDFRNNKSAFKYENNMNKEIISEESANSEKNQIPIDKKNNIDSKSVISKVYVIDNTLEQYMKDIYSILINIQNTIEKSKTVVE